MDNYNFILILKITKQEAICWKKDMEYFKTTVFIRLHKINNQYTFIRGVLNLEDIGLFLALLCPRWEVQSACDQWIANELICNPLRRFPRRKLGWNFTEINFEFINAFAGNFVRVIIKLCKVIWPEVILSVKLEKNYRYQYTNKNIALWVKKHYKFVIYFRDLSWS